MAAKETVPGLLSKVAKFVRNPTKDWSDLDRLDASPESGYDKQALKEMIERKRQNDFVRRREFDQLRKLRSRDGAGVGGLARSSAFQSSVVTDQDGRADTLKKIDEIEAQMSKQWWKGKQDPSATPGAAYAPSATPARPPIGRPADALGQSTQSLRESTGHFTSTRPSAADYNASEQVDTEMGMDMPHPTLAAPPVGRRATDRTPGAGSMANGHDGNNVSFSTSELFAIDADQMATDPELEEAAIRFANGDDAGAELSLLQALRGDAIAPEVALSWAAALLDLHRATQNRAKFNQAVAEFSLRFGPVSPQWERAPAGGYSEAHKSGLSMGGASMPQNSEAHADALWNSPVELNLASMEALREALASHPMPWHVGWVHLQRIAPDAMPLLGGLFASLCDEPVSLHFSGQESLVQTLRKMMPSGDRSIDAAWWGVRLNALRTMQMIDEFELVALDYCVTYEVSPPAWVPARCQFESVQAAVAPAFAATEPAAFHMGASAAGGNANTYSNAHAATVPMPLDGMQQPNAIELKGDVLGDATALLSATGSRYHSGERIIVSCMQLVRVDFSAAGSILNWVALRQSEGCQVQFRDVQRLVAAFFNVIGIHEHARVVPKAI